MAKSKDVMLNASLKQRLVTAGILIPVVILAIYLLPLFYFFLVGCVIAALAAWEWCALAHFKTMFIKIFYVFLILVACALSWALPFELFVLMGFILWIALFIALYRYPKDNDIWKKFASLRGIVGLLMLVAFLASLMVLKKASAGYVLVLLATVWIMDSAAYFAGQKWGKTPLATHISPKKTREGLIIALIGVAVLSLPLVLWVHPYKNASLGWFCLILITAVVSVLGDLVESMAKRMYHIKDSGHLLPGHGGILDRLDSLFAASVCFAFGQMLFS